MQAVFLVKVFVDAAMISFSHGIQAQASKFSTNLCLFIILIISLNAIHPLEAGFLKTYQIFAFARSCFDKSVLDTRKYSNEHFNLD